MHKIDPSIKGSSYSIKLPPIFDSDQDTYSVSLVDKVPYLELDEENLEIKVNLKEFHKLDAGVYTFKL